jgi:hypothetical protein
MSASAELVATDWKYTGDSRATLDDQTGIEWLDLTQTDGMSIDQAENLLSSTFAGWRLPTRSEVTQLMVNAFPSAAENMKGGGSWGYVDSTMDNKVDYFRTLFGSTVANSSYNYTYGIFKNDVVDGQSSVLLSGVNDKVSSDYVMLHSNISHSSSTGFANASYGVYLVSDGGTTLSSINDPSINIGSANVPLPATAALLGLGLLGFGARRKKHG